MSIKQTAPPDQQYGKTGLTDASLPAGSATGGMTGGAMGDLSNSDVRRGYEKLSDKLTDRGPLAPPDESGSVNDGFLGRPGGWER